MSAGRREAERFSFWGPKFPPSLVLPFTSLFRSFVPPISQLSLNISKKNVRWGCRGECRCRAPPSREEHCPPGQLKLTNLGNGPISGTEIEGLFQLRICSLGRLLVLEPVQRPSQRPSQSAIFLSELRVVLPLIALPLKTPLQKIPLNWKNKNQRINRPIFTHVHCARAPKFPAENGPRAQALSPAQPPL